MKHLFQILIIAGLVVFAAQPAFPQAGTLDNSFGNGGIVIYNYGSGYHDFTTDVHVYEDKSTLVCGGYLDNVSYNSTGNMQKFLPDGSVDGSWGTNGLVTFQFGLSTMPNSMIVLPDGKILISGLIVFATDTEFFAARFNSDGTLDMTFNNTGVWIGSYPDNVEMSCNDMVVQEDGKIILAGRNGLIFSTLLFYRLNSDGTLDTGFGTNGSTEINSATQNETVNGVGLLSDGTIIGVGYKHLGDPWYGEFPIMVKLDADGNPFPGFGTDGVMIPSVFDDYSQALDCVIVNDSIVISCALGDPNTGQDLLVTKLGPDGNADPEFGNGGVSILNIDQLTLGEEIYFGGDNKLYFCGTSGQNGIGASRDFFLSRFNYNGSIDNTFAGNGYVKTSVGSAWDHALAMDMGPDGKIVLAGFTAMGPTGDNDRALARYLNDYTPPAPLSADFISDSTVICAENAVIFTDQSLGNITSWNWTFEGGTPATSSLQNPEVEYNTPGVFDVQLEISDGTETVSVLKEDYITVAANPQPEITGLPDVCEGETEIYSTPENSDNSYAWNVVGGEITAGSGTHQIMVLWGDPGSGFVTVTEETPEGCITTTEEYPVTINECTGVWEISGKALQVHPNPADDKLVVSCDDIHSIMVYNIYGQLMVSTEAHEINTSGFENGMYMIVVTTIDGQTKTIKALVSH